MSATIDWNAAGAMKKLMKPGPAISTLASSGEAGKACTSSSATLRGGLPSGLARASARLVAKSPCLLSLVGSRLIVSGAVTAEPANSVASAWRSRARIWSFIRMRDASRDGQVLNCGLYCLRRGGRRRSGLKQIRRIDVHRPAQALGGGQGFD